MITVMYIKIPEQASPSAARFIEKFCVPNAERRAWAYIDNPTDEQITQAHLIFAEVSLVEEHI